MTNPRPAQVIRAIRKLELETAQAVEAARTESEATVAAAGAEARGMVELARGNGREEARKRYEQQVAAAEAEAERIRSSTDDRVRALRVVASPHLGGAVAAMVELLLAPPEEEGV